MPYQLKVVEQENIEKIINLLLILKNQNFIHTNIKIYQKLITNSISITEKIIYTFVYYSNINAYTLSNICNLLHSSINTLTIPYDINIAVELYNAFNILYLKSGNSIRGCFIINSLKSLIDSNQILINTNYHEHIINMYIFEILQIIKKLKQQQFILKICNYKKFNEENYQSVVHQYYTLKKKLDQLDKKKLLRNNNFYQQILIMHRIYARTRYLYKPIKILDNLNLCNKSILDAYYNVIYYNSMRNYNNLTLPNENHIENIKKLAINLRHKLIKCTPNQNFISLTKHKINFFYKYYTQFQVVFCIKKFYTQARTKLELLLNNKNKCLDEKDYSDLTNQYQLLLVKIKTLHQPIFNTMSNQIYDIQKYFQEIYDIYYTRSKQYALLNVEQENFVHLYFKYNPSLNKLSKKINHLGIENQPQEIADFLKKFENILPLGYSVIKAPEKNKLFAILPSKETNLVLRNAFKKNIKGLLGKGVYGKVKLAQDLSDYSNVAVKIQIRQKKETYHYCYIQNEEHIQSILHQFIASSMVSREKSIKYYTFSKLINGIKLLDYLNNHQDLSMEEFVTITIKILYKIEFLHHKMNIIHGDLNLCNILYDATTKSLEIIDFGFAGISDHNGKIPFPGLKITKKYYIAPECYVLKKATFAADIYSIGYWTKWYINNDIFYKLQNTKYPELLKKLINTVNEMLNDNYNLRITSNNCIRKLEELLNEIKHHDQLKLAYNTL